MKQMKRLTLSSILLSMSLVVAHTDNYNALLKAVYSNEPELVSSLLKEKALAHEDKEQLLQASKKHIQTLDNAFHKDMEGVSSLESNIDSWLFICIIFMGAWLLKTLYSRRLSRSLMIALALIPFGLVTYTFNETGNKLDHAVRSALTQSHNIALNKSIEIFLLLTDWHYDTNNILQGPLIKTPILTSFYRYTPSKFGYLLQKIEYVIK